MKIISYVVRRDFGFAPNPFFDYCTLATCKPDIRKSAVIGDWIIGTSSKSTGSSNKLVFAMKVTEKLSFDKYWNDARFFDKRPILERSRKFQYGDNIYHQDNSEWVQIASHHSYEDGSINHLNVTTDTKTDSILISDHFYYFGGDAVIIPENLRKIIKAGPGHKYVNSDLHDDFLSNFLSKHDLGLNGSPFEWTKLHSQKSPQLGFQF